MPRILNFGSINIDHVYDVDHFVAPGETLSSSSYARHAGGKGFNQSIALARAGAAVAHAGAIGADGLWLRDLLTAEGVDVSAVRVTDGPTGHAVIQVVPQGQNAIVLHAGANAAITADAARETLAAYGPGDWLVAQNEISALDAILAAAAARGLRVAFNPAPMDAAALRCPLDAVGCFLLNEVEAAQLAGEADERRACEALRQRFPAADVVVTLGPRGVIGAAAGEATIGAWPAHPAAAIDTTAAGDTFIGYFLAERLRGATFAAAIFRANAAAAISITRRGAAASIPRRDEVDPV